MIAEQVGRPPVGLTTHEAIEILEAHPRRPLVEGAGRAAVLKARGVVVLAEPRGGKAVLLEDFPDGSVLRPDDGIIAWIPGGQLPDNAEADRVMVTASDQRRPRGRAKSGGVELRVTQTRLGYAIHGRRGDDTAKGARHAVALVVRHDEKNVGRAVRRHDARRPVRLGIGGSFLDHAAERHRWRWNLFSVNGDGGVGRTGGAVDF